MVPDTILAPASLIDHSLSESRLRQRAGATAHQESHGVLLMTRRRVFSNDTVS